jgi:hypothetical protein
MSSERARLAELEMAGDSVFHGSSEEAETLEPRQAHNFVGGEHVMDGSPAVFASSNVDYAVLMALVNKKNCPKGFYSHVSKFGKSKEDALLKLSMSRKTLEQLTEESTGYIYVFDRKGFSPRDITEIEFVSNVSVKPREIIKIKKSDLLQEVQILDD